MKLLSVVLLLLVFTFSNYTAQKGYEGKVWESEKEIWIDDSTGYEITRWTSESENWHLYFNLESFIDDDNAIIFSKRSGKLNLFKMNLVDGSITQMTDETNLKQSVWHIPEEKTLWFFCGDTLKKLNTKSSKTSAVNVFDKTIPESFVIINNGKWLVFSANKNPGFSQKHSTCPYTLFKMNLNENKIIQISPDYGFLIEHVQTNPVDTNIISFCWQLQYREGEPGIVGNTPIRMWWNNLDGSDGGPVRIQEFGLHRTHEFWFPDGKRMGYLARYLFGPNKGKQFIGIAKINDRENIMYPANVSAAHSQVFKDGIHWVSDQFNGMKLVMFTLGQNKIDETKILFRHGSLWNEQRSHPHPHFSSSGKYILFSKDKTGRAQVCSVKINLDKK
jgi:hypothetical protein